MLSIRFDDQREWWVSGAVFERLFSSALDGGDIPAELAHWREVADANGGLDLSLLEPVVAEQLGAALRRAAGREVAALGEPDETTPDGSYRAALQRLLGLADSP